MMRKRKTVKVVLLSILCFVLVMVLGASVLVTVSMRHTAKEQVLMSAVEKLPLEDINLNDSTIAQYILDEFVADDRVSVENVQRVMQEGTFSTFAAELVEQYNSYLLDGGEFPKLAAEDFVRLIEENEALILEETGLEFLDPDKQKLSENLAAPLKIWNQAMERSMHRGVGGFAARAAFSLWLPIVFGVLLLVIMIWMLRFYVRGGFRAGTALKVFSIALFIPCAVMLLGLVLTDAVAGLNIPFLKDSLGMLSSSLMPIAGVGALTCAVIFGAGLLCNLIFGKHQPAMSEDYSYDGFIPAEPEPELQPESDEQSEEALLVEEPEPEMKRQFCRNCGQPLVNPDAKFCYRCGNIQEHVHTEE